jgi:hypothetical protein
VVLYMYLEKIFTKCWKLICKIVRSVDPMKLNKKLDVACRYSKFKQQKFQFQQVFNEFYFQSHKIRIKEKWPNFV